MPSLFTQIVKDEDLNALFQPMLHRAHTPAREALQTAFDRLPNPDGNFIKDFQTTGFNARVWELYLLAYGAGTGYTVERPHDRPDFLFRKGGASAWLEAVTANPTPGQAPPPHGDIDAPDFLDAFRLRDYEFLPIKYGSPLFSKLNMRYWELPHVAGLPFVIAIEDFHDCNPFRDASNSVMQYLYGQAELIQSPANAPLVRKLQAVTHHRFGNKVIPSGFFHQAGAEHISAVVFSNSGTVPKFNRMGYDSVRHAFLKLIRRGWMIDFDPDAVVPQPFAYVVGDGTHKEPWGEGLEVFHNPRPNIPLPDGFFEDATEHRVTEQRFESRAPAFCPLSSVTITIAEKNGEAFEDNGRFQEMAEASLRPMRAAIPFGERAIRELLKAPIDTSQGGGQ